MQPKTTDNKIVFEFNPQSQVFFIAMLTLLIVAFPVLIIDHNWFSLGDMKYPTMFILTFVIVPFLYQRCLIYENEIVLQYPFLNLQKAIPYDDIKEVQILATGRGGRTVVFYYKKRIWYSKGIAFQAGSVNYETLDDFFKKKKGL